MSNAATRRFALLSPAVGSANIGDQLIELAVRRLLGDHEYHLVSVRRQLGDAEIEVINSCEAALLCGTNLYQRDWECELTTTALDRIDVPVIPVGVGSSASTLAETGVGATTARMIRALHERCLVGSVRDPHSESVVRGVGVENVVLTGCPVLYWAGGPQPAEPRPRSRLIVTARNWLMHHWPDAVDNPVQIELLRSVLSEFRSYEVVFAVHEPFDERLLELIPVPEAIVVRPESTSFVDLYTDDRAVVLGMRLHAAMLALANAVPTVLVGHDTRTYSFAQMLGIEHIELFDSAAPSQCIDAISAMLSGGLGGSDAMGSRFQALHAGMARFLAANGLPLDGLHRASAGESQLR